MYKIVNTLFVARQRGQIAEERFGCKNLRTTDYHFPVLYSSRYLVRTTHLRVADAAHDEDDQTRHVFDDRLSFVLVPVSIASTAAMVSK